MKLVVNKIVKMGARIKKNSYVYAIQAKYYTAKLDNTPIQEIVATQKYYNADQGVVITNSDFSIGAKKLAFANNVLLIDGENLQKIVNCTSQNNGIDILKSIANDNL